MGDSREGLGGSAGANDNDCPVAEHTAEHRFLDFDAFDLAEHHLDGAAANQADFDDDTVIGDSHFGCIASGGTNKYSYEGGHKADGPRTLKKVQGVGVE